MPQLDALTYFSQFVYLLISFIAVYLFVLNTVIPKVHSALKLRQKVNTVARLTKTLESILPVDDCGGPFVRSLRSSKWCDSTKYDVVRPSSARALQMATTLILKKQQCGFVLSTL